MNNILNGAAIDAAAGFVYEYELKDKSKFCLRAINFEANKIYLKDKPFKQVLDLAIIGYFKSFYSEAVLTYEVLQLLGISFEEFCEIAYANFRNESHIGVDYESAYSLIEKKEDYEEEEDLEDEGWMLIIGDEYHPEATALLGDQKWLEDKHKKYGDYYIFPLSCHEILLAPTELGRAARALPIKDLIKRGRVTPGEVLSVYIYKFDGALSIVSASNIDN